MGANQLPLTEVSIERSLVDGAHEFVSSTVLGDWNPVDAPTDYEKINSVNYLGALSVTAALAYGAFNAVTYNIDANEDDN